MPYESDKQRRFMYAKHPDIAKKREAEGKAYVKPKPKKSDGSKSPSRKSSGSAGSSKAAPKKGKK